MRNKESFLKELQSRLAVLEEAEQQDILSEYAQHIDLRVSGGLTEEEAIRDFGDIEQLAAEILGAYHVRLTYQVPTEKKKLRLPDPRPAVRRGAAGAATFFRWLGGGIKAGLLRGKDRLKGLAGRWSAWWNNGFFKHWKQAASPGTVDSLTETPCGEKASLMTESDAINKEQAEIPVEEETGMEQRKKTVWSGLGTFFRRLGHGLWRLLRAAVWLAWNLFLLLCALPFACLGLAALICLGLLAVLLVQGYPLVGVTLCCLGGAACCVGILGLGSGLIWHRARDAALEAPVAGLKAERGEVTADDGE